MVVATNDGQSYEFTLRDGYSETGRSFQEIVLGSQVNRSFSNLFRNLPRGMRAIFVGWWSGASVGFVWRLEKHRIPYRLHDDGLAVELWGANVVLRRSSSDAQCLADVCLESQYDIAVSALKSNGKDVKAIVDLGGNIGLATLQFASEFPDAKCIVVEADRSNAARARKHLSELSNVRVIEAGIWSKSGTLYTNREYADGLDWAISVSDTRTEHTIDEIPAVSMSEIIREANLEVIDLLKVDVEGAEGELFVPHVAASFLSKTRIIAIEIHDALVSRNDIEGLLKSNGFVIFHHGELTIGINTKMASSIPGPMSRIPHSRASLTTAE